MSKVGGPSGIDEDDFRREVAERYGHLPESSREKYRDARIKLEYYGSMGDENSDTAGKEYKRRMCEALGPLLDAIWVQHRDKMYDYPNDYAIMHHDGMIDLTVGQLKRARAFIDPFYEYEEK